MNTNMSVAMNKNILTDKDDGLDTNRSVAMNKDTLSLIDKRLHAITDSFCVLWLEVNT